MSEQRGISVISRLQIDTAATKVHAALRKLIVSGDIGPGSRLIETELAGQFGISRVPVREALQQLENEGLVTSTPSRGKIVVRLTTAEIRDTYAVRAVLEGLAGRLALENRSVEMYGKLRDILARMREAAENGDARVVSQLDADFHMAVWEMSSNSVLSEALTRLLARIRIYIPITVREDGALATWSEHAEILAALESGDPVAVEECMRHHIEASAASLAQWGEESK